MTNSAETMREAAAIADENARQLDAIVHALEIEDSFTSPLEAIAEKDATIARLSADLALTREALDRFAALDPDGARAALAKLSEGA